MTMKSIKDTLPDSDTCATRTDMVCAVMTGSLLGLDCVKNILKPHWKPLKDILIAEVEIKHIQDL